MDMEEESQRNMEAEHKGLESRITAGPISNIISLNLVDREGCALVLDCIEKRGDKWVRYFRLNLEEGSYFEDISLALGDQNIEQVRPTEELNKGLREENLYLSHFIRALPPYKNGLGNWVIGSADVYSDKDITVDETGSFRKISQPAKQ